MRFGIIFSTNLCYKCIYHVPNNCMDTMERSTCSKFDMYADVCRFDEKKCGMEGKYFKEKDKGQDHHYDSDSLSEKNH